MAGTWSGMIYEKDGGNEKWMEGWIGSPLM